MSNKRKITRFSRRYESFLSEASNEEIVSISKELTEEMSSQIRSANLNAMAILAISIVALLMSITLVTDLSTSISSTIKNTIFLLRMIAIALMCITMMVAYIVIQRISSASSFSPLMWRRIRETATDENTYEQMDAVRALDFALVSAKNLNVTATLTLVLSGMIMGISYIYQTMAAAGYM